MIKKNQRIIRVRPEDFEFIEQEHERLKKLLGNVPRTLVITELVRDRKLKRQTKKQRKEEEDLFGL